MKNRLMKNKIMNNDRINEKIPKYLNILELKYDYEYSHLLSNDRNKISETYLNRSEITDLIVFKYENIKFNMISCPPVPGIPHEIKYPKEKRVMIGETEVTQELFDAVMGFNYSYFKGEKNPVERVSGYDCLEFCNRLSIYFGLDPCYVLINKELGVDYNETEDNEDGNEYDEDIIINQPNSIKSAAGIRLGNNGFRLPYPFEWNHAAKAFTNNTISGTSAVSVFEDNPIGVNTVAWLWSSSENKTHPVAQKLPNEWGFYDMTGNVREWTVDWEEYPSPFQHNENQTRWKVAGGTYRMIASDIEKSPIWFINPSRVSRDTGFRIARYDT
jgi:hypothetical protein